MQTFSRFTNKRLVFQYDRGEKLVQGKPTTNVETLGSKGKCLITSFMSFIITARGQQVLFTFLIIIVVLFKIKQIVIPSNTFLSHQNSCHLRIQKPWDNYFWSMAKVISQILRLENYKFNS